MRAVVGSILLVAVVAVAILGFRGRIGPSRPLMLVPDMDFQPRYEAQGASPFFADGRTMRTPPAGTVAFGGGGYATDPDSPIGGSYVGGYYSDAGGIRPNIDFAAADPAYATGRDANGAFVAEAPRPADLDLLKRGQERFNINCAPCHGQVGAGNGITTQYGLGPVPTYHDDRLRKMPDGEIFHTITNGKGLMAAYDHQVKVPDRWAIVAYIRALQRSQNAQLDDVPATLRAEVTR